SLNKTEVMYQPGPDHEHRKHRESIVTTDNSPLKSIRNSAIRIAHFPITPCWKMRLFSISQRPA
ncbi:hypothetical protein KIL84_005541, partial [Mauremys mutica]